jgi:hypothetical protein
MSEECPDLREVTIPLGHLEEVGPLAFSGCSGLRKMVIPACVKKVGYRASWNCSGLSQVVT